MKDFLKELMGENYSEEIETKIFEEIEKNYVGKEDYEKVVQEGVSDERVQEIENSYKQEIRQIKLQNAIDSALSVYGAKNKTAVTALLDKEQITVDENGLVSGVDEQMKTLQKSDAFLFDTQEIKGLKPAEKSDTAYKGPKDMSYGELCDYFKTKNKK